MMVDTRRQVGRVVFGNSDWIILTLASHVNNVARLVELWDAEKAYLGSFPSNLKSTHALAVEAARVHDMAKPSHFRLTYEGFRGGSPKWGYSFAGHRFAVDYPQNRYVELLGQLHHEYSVDGLTKAIAELRNREPAFRDIAVNLPLDLYTLEMADQIEATVARAAVDATEPEARVFMDFTFDVIDRQKAIYRIEPFPFVEEPVQLSIEYAPFSPPTKLREAVEQAKPEKRGSALRQLKGRMEEALQEATLEEREIALWSWTKS